MHTQRTIKAGIIGCGNISGIYLENGIKFSTFELIACADLDLDKARIQADKYDIPLACTAEELLAHPEIELVINLTIPAVHAQVSLQALEAGKHVYVEKPLALTLEQGQAVLETAEKNGLLVGSAPDTFLGAGVQTALKLITEGAIGRPVAATAFMMSRGHESWHPDPEFYYADGGGPMFDMGTIQGTRRNQKDEKRTNSLSCKRFFDFRGNEKECKNTQGNTSYVGDVWEK